MYNKQRSLSFAKYEKMRFFLRHVKFMLQFINSLKSLTFSTPSYFVKIQATLNTFVVRQQGSDGQTAQRMDRRVKQRYQQIQSNALLSSS